MTSFGANVLTDEDNIIDDQLITISKQAFLTSGHNVSVITDINIKRAMTHAAYKLSHPTTHMGTRVTRFDIYTTRS